MKKIMFSFDEGHTIESVEQFLREVREFAGAGNVTSCFRGEPKATDSEVGIWSF